MEIRSQRKKRGAEYTYKRKQYVYKHGIHLMFVYMFVFLLFHQIYPLLSICFKRYSMNKIIEREKKRRNKLLVHFIICFVLYDVVCGIASSYYYRFLCGTIEIVALARWHIHIHKYTTIIYIWWKMKWKHDSFRGRPTNKIPKYFRV